MTGCGGGGRGGGKSGFTLTRRGPDNVLAMPMVKGLT